MTEDQEFNESLRKIKYDRDEREKFWFKYYNKLKLHVLLKYGTFSDWEDIVHDVVSKLISNDWTDYPYIENPTAWLYKVADNHAKDIFKKTNRICEFDEQTYSNFSIEAVELRNDIRNAIKQLKRDKQYIIYAHYWLGKELYTIAEEMNKSYGSVRAEAKRAKDILEKIFVTFSL